MLDKSKMTLQEAVEYLDEKIRYMECIKAHLAECKQIEQERDIALQQLKNAGLMKGEN